jgi:hypothetical protein
MPEKFAPRFPEIDRLIRTPPGTLTSRLEVSRNPNHQVAKNGDKLPFLLFTRLF